MPRARYRSSASPARNRANKKVKRILTNMMELIELEPPPAGQRREAYQTRRTMLLERIGLGLLEL